MTVRADELRVGAVSADGAVLGWACLLSGGGAPDEVSLVWRTADGGEQVEYLAPSAEVAIQGEAV